ncbi:MAG TPA: hypothetical protein VMP89_12855 [Solirubrobacteraceae bacterium]|nr:hypothetical protein [Solirubrobacteraceae bacterium]
MATIACVILAGVLPRLVVPALVLAGVSVVVRLVLHHTRKW